MISRSRGGTASILWIAIILLAQAGCMSNSAPKGKSSEGLFAAISSISGGEDTTPELDIEGMDGALLENARAHLSLGKDACDTPLWRIHRHYEQAEKDIGKALRVLGYYEPVVEKRLILPCATGEPGDVAEEGTDQEGCKEDCWSARFTVAPGGAVRVAAIDLTVRGEAREEPAFLALQEELPIREGDILHHARYEQIKADIMALAATLGYVDGRFTVHELRVDPSSLQATIRLVYDSGPRHRFGELTIRHPTLDDDIIQGIVDWREGEPFDSKELTRIYRDLVHSDYFATVEVRPRFRGRGDQRIPVDIDLMPRKRYRFSFGLGMSTDDGPSGSFSAINRRFNTRGHRWSSDTSISLVKSTVGAEYRIPLADPRADWLSFQGGYQRKDTDTARSQSLRLGARRTHRYFDDWLGTVSLDVLREDFEAGATDDIATMVVAGVGFFHGRYEERIRPRWGHRLDLKLNMSQAMFGSDNDFVQGHVSGKWVRGMSWGGRLLLRGELGASWIDDFSTLPTSYRFFAGGDKSVRGYGFHALGPKDGQGDVIGGPHIMVGSLEYEHPVAKEWALTTFVDHGNALDNEANLFGSALKTSVGVGVRWFSPFGPAGVDLAFPLDEDDSTFRVHLNVGIDL
uniref:Translocation and assembly module subunit TamA n=1 Tax=Candidatus Kentrum sp. LPFa TaxID=2126335 RepID=A0A450XA70_9GAMM|nr:MAG: translocation and assembly module TamA [Candidatus Kentron sp. LPFa]VFK26175.1 MAG: translocation and assembly module TamA [Candidatus Kentron sp. LPFa]